MGKSEWSRVNDPRKEELPRRIRNLTLAVRNVFPLRIEPIVQKEEEKKSQRGVRKPASTATKRGNPPSMRSHLTAEKELLPGEGGRPGKKVKKKPRGEAASDFPHRA